MTKKEQIDYLLKDYPDLKCNLVYDRDIDFIESVLNLDYWKKEKYQKLLTSNIWFSNIFNIINIMELPYWEDPKFKSLLTSNIWKRNYFDVKNILEMEEWNNATYQNLLTSNIWKSSYEEVKRILNMEILKDKRYSHLLVPSIFNVSIDNIIPTIELLDRYNISEYVTNRCLRRNYLLTEKLIEFMLDNNIPLLVESIDGSYKLNRMLSDSNTYLKEECFIDIKSSEQCLKLVNYKKCC